MFPALRSSILIYLFIFARCSFSEIKACAKGFSCSFEEKESAGLASGFLDLRGTGNCCYRGTGLLNNWPSSTKAVLSGSCRSALDQK